MCKFNRFCLIIVFGYYVIQLKAITFLNVFRLKAFFFIFGFHTIGEIKKKSCYSNYTNFDLGVRIDSFVQKSQILISTKWKHI